MLKLTEYVSHWRYPALFSFCLRLEIKTGKAAQLSEPESVVSELNGDVSSPFSAIFAWRALKFFANQFWQRNSRTSCLC